MGLEGTQPFNSFLTAWYDLTLSEHFAVEGADVHPKVRIAGTALEFSGSAHFVEWPGGIGDAATIPKNPTAKEREEGVTRPDFLLAAEALRVGVTVVTLPEEVITAAPAATHVNIGATGAHSGVVRPITANTNGVIFFDTLRFALG